MNASDNTTRVGQDTSTNKANDKVSGLLVNVFGLKLPNDMFSQAARYDDELADVLRQHARRIANAKR